MKINLPINEFKLKGNKIYINDLIVEYEEISEDTKEVLESLISKGAYGSALLTLNTFYNVKSFNESNYSHKDYLSYLGECNKLLKECVVEVHKAHNFRPLINLNGLEIMESKNNIARGKGDTLLIEDFRNINKSASEGLPIKEEAEGTQTTDIAEKKDQSVGPLRKPRKRKKLIVKEAGGVPRNHGFKGFMMDDSGFYSRGNYVLVKEGSKIKAVNKKSLKEHSYIKNK